MRRVPIQTHVNVFGHVYASVHGKVSTLDVSVGDVSFCWRCILPHVGVWTTQAILLSPNKESGRVYRTIWKPDHTAVAMEADLCGRDCFT